jgi:hypothetical protein
VSIGPRQVWDWLREKLGCFYCGGRHFQSDPEGDMCAMRYLSPHSEEWHDRILEELVKLATPEQHKAAIRLAHIKYGWTPK